MVRIFKGSCLANRILAVVSQQGLVLGSGPIKGIPKAGLA